MPRKKSGSLEEWRENVKALKQRELKNPLLRYAVLGDGSDAPTLIADWSEVDNEYVIWLLRVVTANGGNVTFGQTKERDQYVITLYFHPDREARYFSPTEGGRKAMYDWIRGIAEFSETL